MADRETVGRGWFGMSTSSDLPKPNIQFQDNSALESLKERKEPSLSELNPLLYPPDLLNNDAISALEFVTRRKIDEVSGLQPQVFESILVGPKLEPRLVIRFSVDSLSSHQVGLLEGLVREMYGISVKTRVNSSGNAVASVVYPRLEQKAKKPGSNDQTGTSLGWYMGPDTTPLSSSHMGLLVYKDFGDAGMVGYLRSHPADEWFFKDDLVNPMGRQLKSKYLVELREGTMYQTDVVASAVQIGSVLANGKLLDDGELLYQVFNDLNRLGLKKTTRDQIFGLDEQMDRIDRSLVLPLANISLSSGIRFKPGSILLIGVPGTGKTAVVERLLQEDTGIFILPIDPLQLARDLNNQPEKRTLLPRIAQVFHRTQKPVVIHLDDVENIATGDQQINSTLLNLMAGVRESGFYVLASTNYPEKLNSQLLQPQRFAHVIHFGLHDEEARYGILDVHATRVSRELDIPLFDGDQQRESILRVIAAHTESFTPRYLAEVCTEAKSFLLQRIARLAGARIGLTEQHLRDFRLDVEDWEKALMEVNKKYDKRATEQKDRELREFAEKYTRPAGFHPNGGLVFGTGYFRSAVDRLTAEY